jgi:hypothetical protein
MPTVADSINGPVRSDRMNSVARTTLLAMTWALTAVPETGRADADKPDPRNGVYELRVYTCDPGRLEALNTRFREHTIKLFEKHGMINVAYFVPTEAPAAENTLVYFLWHQSADAAAASFRAFRADPDWISVRTESEKEAKILAKPVESTFLKLTDYSAPLPAARPGRVYELRTYTAPEGKLEALHARFRDHTLRLFEKHGMENVAYFVPADEPNSANTLIYLLAHKSRDAARESWKAFLNDPDWKAVHATSEANGTLVEKIESVFLEPTDYSPKPKAE